MATCDRWDIGGLSTAEPPGHRGARRSSSTTATRAARASPSGPTARRRPGCAATREAIASCGCETGCPSCVQSPKCGNGNNPLDKDAAVAVLDAVLAALAQQPAGPTPLPR